MDTGQLMSILLFLATALMLFVSFLSYRKRHLQVARTMVFMMLAASIYALGYALEILSSSLQEVKLSLQIEYFGIPFVTIFWLILVIQFTGVAARYRRRLVIGLLVIPVAIFFLHLTNDWHHLIYKEYVLNTNSELPLYTTVKGIGYHIHALYSYFILAFGMLLFIPMYLKSLPVVRKQIVVLILGATAPMLCNIAFFFGILVDLTPFGFAISGLVYVWGIFRFNLLRLTPLALAKVFDTIRDGVVLLDNENQIVNCNRAAEEVFPMLGTMNKYPASGKALWTAYPELLERIQAVESGDERFSFQQYQNNQRKHYNCTLTFIYDMGQIPIGKMLMFNNITELIENEERLRENAKQLSHLNAFKDKLFTVVAHDIRDPIALLVSLTELLGEEQTDEEIVHAELFREIKEQVRGTFQLVDHLLDWYRSQKGEIVFRPQSWNLRQVVNQALSLVGARAGMKNIQMIERINETLTVSADKEMLDLIFRNLLSNAIKFTGIGGTIAIGAFREGDQVVVSVSDNGMGIDEETSKLLRQEEMFFKEPGYSNERNEMRFGLVLTREFLRIHGGNLQFDSVPGEGTTFRFSLPGTVSGAGTMKSNGMAVKAYENHTG
ncbi:histidine kinase N-terminal 7TM domain-containing protein [Cohnella sp. WQ 127256]|uniref:sensor histidine kinase n=1 Tax=Cohnella sp. WQ 127256 TaxID=2938790 RepID=UPI00211844A3